MPEPPRPADSPEPERAARILLVDGTGRLRAELGAALREGGHEVLSHASVVGLSAFVERVEPDLLLLDTGLPDVSSFEVCGALRATEAGRKTPIMLVADREPAQETIARGLLCGADDFCVSPSRSVELLARVRVQLRNKRERDRLRRGGPRAAPPPEVAPPRVASPSPLAGKAVAPLERALIDKLTHGLAGLPILAEAATEAMRLAGDAQTDIAKIARLVDRDPPLAARFVAVASSAVYAGRASRATTTQQALVRIGLATARDLLYQIVYERSGQDLPRYRRDVGISFRRSVRAALASRMLAAEVRYDFPYAYLAGLLHDIGEARIYRILAYLPNAPEDGAELADLVARHHQRAGAGLAEAWKLPAVIADACGAHHGEPAKLSAPLRLVAAADAAVRLADSAPAFADEDLDRLAAINVRPERVKSIVEALSITFSEVDARPAAAAAAAPSPAPVAAVAGARR